jgi:hypothetical protein
MMRDLEKRLRKLESRLPPLPDAHVCQMEGIQWFALAYYLGNPSRDEEPFAAFARALGYANESQLNSALDDNAVPSWRVRDRFYLAWGKLFAKFDVDCDVRSFDPNKLLEALERMEAGLPKSYKKRLKTILARTDINLGWMQDNDLASFFRCFA